MTSNGSPPLRLRLLLPDAQVFPASADPVASTICDQATAIRPGDVYVHLDGFDCIGAVQAAERGAAAVITERLLPEVPAPQLIVADCWEARRVLAAAAREEASQTSQQRTGPHVITVAASYPNDQTATLIATILTMAGQTTALRTDQVDDDGQTCSPLSDNNRPSIGDWFGRATNNNAAMTVLATTRSDGLRVPPRIACLTGIQLNGPTTQERRARTAAALGALSRDTILVANADDAECMRIAAQHTGPLLTFGSAAHADVRIVVNTEHTAGQRVLATASGHTAALDLDRPGSQRRREGGAALAVAVALGLELAPTARSLSIAPDPMQHLQRQAPADGVIVLTDCARHPTHLRETLVSADQLTTGRVIVVAELSERINRAEQQLTVLEALADRSFTVGRAEGLTLADPRVTAVADRESAIAIALGLADEGDVVVLAGATHESAAAETAWIDALMSRRRQSDQQRRAA
ncbi:glutamate ligase domain-containing protein [Botrimarina hoheduenensis]|uniref:MurE-like ligase n=1 Tax=Botrimarina hoheduenensis TaxID=2528000 RepID=A0A5C5WDG0_9BACT|nr:hypothetical protein [Botrimarina hoheduenensis]TWT48724.1 MurE-like ligase [Botrimarina hoheduenensis]